MTSAGSRCVITKRASGNERSSWSRKSRCVGHFSRHRLAGAPHCSSCNVRRSYAYVDVRSASYRNQSEYVGRYAYARKICDLKSSAISSWHSMGPVAVDGTSAALRGENIRCCSTCIAATSMRGSGPATVDGGGGGAADSHSRNERVAGSWASRNDSAVEPVRGRPRPMSGASIGSSAISGCRRNQSSICKRCARRPTMRPRIASSPMALSFASCRRPWTRISSPSRKVSPPKSSRPVCARAASMRSSCSAMSPLSYLWRAYLAGLVTAAGGRGRVPHERLDVVDRAREHLLVERDGEALSTCGDEHRHQPVAEARDTPGHDVALGDGVDHQDPLLFRRRLVVVVGVDVEQVEAQVLVLVVTPEHAHRRSTGLDAVLHERTMLDHERDGTRRHRRSASTGHRAPPARSGHDRER